MFEKYPCVRQHDQSDCGAAALSTVAKHYRVNVGIGRIRNLIGTDKVGSTLLGLQKGAEKIGFAAKGAKGDWDGLTAVPLPVICHWKSDEGYGHFVVVHHLAKDKVTVADPGRGLVEYTKEDFLKHWTGYALILTPQSLRPVTPSVSKAEFLWGLMAPHRGILGWALVCALLFTILGLGTSIFVEHLVDEILIHARTQLLKVAGIGMLLLLMFRAAFSGVRSYMLVDIARKVDLTLISCYMRHVLHLPMKFFETRRVGEVLSRVNDAVKIRAAISSTVLTAVVDGTMVLAAAIAMLLTDRPLALAALAFVPASFLTVVLARWRVKKLQRQAMERGAEVEARLVEDVSGAETIKAFCSEDSRSEQSGSRLVRFVKSLFAVDGISITLSTYSFVLVGAGTLTVLWYGGQRVIDGKLTIGQLMYFYSLAGYMFGPLENLSSVYLTIQDATVALDRLWEIIQLELEPVAEEDEAALEPLRKVLRFEKVTFGYGYRGEVLQKVDMDIPAGKTVAIVGESGSGKSTLCKLIARFYEPVSGNIKADGVDLRDLPLAQWRRKIGYVSQEPFIFNGTIAQNIAFGRPDATMAEIARAAQQGGLDAFINDLPERYSTMIGERGMNMSGGQRQRLAIARAILLDPEIFIFDEATSHLDTRTERAIQKTLREALKGRTAVLVAHRLSTVKNADIIYVLQNGVVTEKGSHDELLEKRGEYCTLWRAQSGGITVPKTAAPAAVSAGLTNVKAVPNAGGSIKGPALKEPAIKRPNLTAPPAKSVLPVLPVKGAALRDSRVETEATVSA